MRRLVEAIPVLVHLQAHGDVMKFKAFQYTSQEDPLKSGIKTSTRFPSNAYGRAV